MFHSPKRKNNYDENKNEVENNNNDDKLNDITNSDKKEKIEDETINEKLEFQNQIYNLKFGYNSQNNSLFFELCPKNVESIQTFFYYKNTYSYTQLTKICKFFKMYDSIQEIFSSFCLLLKNKKVFLKINEQSSFNIVLLLNSIIGSEEEVNFPLERYSALKEENNNQNNTNNNKCQCEDKLKEINLKFENLEKNLRQENFDLKNEIYYLKNDINKYTKTIESNKKEIKSLKEQIKALKNTVEKIISTNNETKNITSYEDNNIYENDKNIIEPKEKKINLNNQKDTKSSNISSKNNKINFTNNSTQDNKKKNNINNKNEINQSKTSKNQNQEKMKNNKREIYRQLKEENAKKLNTNKAKSSFRDFLNQKKLNSEKNRNKVLTKSYTSTGSNLLPNKKNQEKIEEENNSTNINDEEHYESDGEINEDKNIEEENFRYKNMFQEEEKEERDEKYDNEEKEEGDNNEENKGENSDMKKSKEMNRYQMIDEWTEDFNINVKKLLEDNETKLRYTEKLNFMNRRIITKVEELQLIENQLMKEYPTIKNIEYNLIFRATEHGDSAKIFHEKCNGGNNLVLIKIKDDIKFGGYTKESWDGENIYKKDNNAFCFCLNKNKIYKVENDKNAILCDINMGPCFGDKFIQVFDNFLEKGGKCYNNENCGFTGMEDGFEITNGIEDFNIEEIEVYKLNFYY